MKKTINSDEIITYNELALAPLYLKHIFKNTQRGSAMSGSSWPDWSNHNQIVELMNNPINVKFNSYCLECKEFRIFKYTDKASIIENWIKSHSRGMFSAGIRYHEFECSLNNQHRLNFTFKVGKDFITKIGQYPSAADLEVIPKDYSKILDEEKQFEFKRSIGLKSFGVGIGSYVYLRRIIETLIKNAHDYASKSAQWDEEKYKSEDIKGRIKLLDKHLPKFLIENKKIYSILSKGIHELNETECIKYYDVLKNCIEMILDEQLESERKINKLESLSQALDDIDEELKS